MYVHTISILIFLHKIIEPKKHEIFEDIPGGHSFDRIDTKAGREIRLKIWKFLAKELDPNNPIDSMDEMFKASYLR